MADEDPHRAYGRYSAYMTEEERRQWERLLAEYDAEVAAAAAASEGEAAAAGEVMGEMQEKGKGKAVASDAAGWTAGETQEKGKEVSRRRKDAVDQQKRAKYHREKNEYVRLVVTHKEAELLKNSGAMGVPDVEGVGLARQQSKSSISPTITRYAPASYPTPPRSIEHTNTPFPPQASSPDTAP